MSEDELKSPENGIWLCGSHASLVDKHLGEDYPASTLFAFKSLHEAKISYEHSGVTTPFGWVDHIFVHSSPLFAVPSKIELAKVTLLTGANSAGKTALCEWIMACTLAKHLERWQNRPKDRDGLCFDISYFCPAHHVVKISFVDQEYPDYRLDNAETFIPCSPIKFICPRDIDFRGQGERDDMELVADALGLHRYEVLALCKELSSTDFGFVNRAWFQDEEDTQYMFAQCKHTNAGRRPIDVPLRLLSDSERVRVLAELAIHAANHYSLVSPTILILDSGFWRLDAEWLKRYVKLLISPSCRFQTIASIGPKRVNVGDWRWEGWRLYRFLGTPPTVRMDTDFRNNE